MEEEKTYADISTLKKGDFITDGEEYCKVFDVYVKDGELVADCTDSGDCVKYFKQGSKVWKEEPPWLVKAREKCKSAWKDGKAEVLIPLDE
jgi:translation elongation factor P/translation initiation factor 5A